jgi:hypothetical protein
MQIILPFVPKYEEAKDAIPLAMESVISVDAVPCCD